MASSSSSSAPIDRREIARRRTFAIVSHPDAGKTTLTEKLLLYGGALHLAGSVTARKNARATSSDWMELEKQRGISISSTVLQFEYQDHVVNLLDTPGHHDFSEDTYRVLTAVDAVIMLLDAAKGVEPQTRKLLEVCKKRKLPIFTFVNKVDRPALEPLALLDELETELGLATHPMTWPLGSGPDFRGVYDRENGAAHLFERVAGGAYRSPLAVHDLDAPELAAEMTPDLHTRVTEEIQLLDAVGGELDHEAVLAGTLTPVYFGSAINNFGVQLLLDSFLRLAPPPQSRAAGETRIEPDRPSFSGFVFKIQANLDPKHRDRLAFIRICSGRFERDMQVMNTRLNKRVRLAHAHRLFGRDRDAVEEAFPGDVVGLVGRSDFRIGDTLSEEGSLEFDAIPQFAPECFAWLHNDDLSNVKRFRLGVEQLLQEGVVQSFRLANAPSAAPFLGAVGRLQFEVLQYRLESEYGAKSRLENASWEVMRWVSSGDPEDVRLPMGARLGYDNADTPVILFNDQWSVDHFAGRTSELTLTDTPPGSYFGRR